MGSELLGQYVPGHGADLFIANHNLALVCASQLFRDRGHPVAGAAPLGPKAHEHRFV